MLGRGLNGIEASARRGAPRGSLGGVIRSRIDMRFGPFEIVRPLGRGGMAETFHARWTGSSGITRDVCLKRVLPARAAEPDFIHRFRREARLAAQLTHPRIVPLYDFGCEGETWWMALELVRGGDLRGLLDALRQPMPLDAGLVLLVDMLEALRCAHEHGIIHRDVSPSNILVDLRGNFKLADFGIAKGQLGSSRGSTIFSTTMGVVQGKAAYMAPEQALAQELDGRADLWSLGVVMFEAFAGAKPFDGPNDIAVMMAANQGRRPRLIDVASHVPDDVAALIEGLLQPDRGLRIASASDALEYLANRPAPPGGRRRIAKMLQAMGIDVSAAPGPRAVAPAAMAQAPPDEVPTLESAPPIEARDAAAGDAAAGDAAAGDAAARTGSAAADVELAAESRREARRATPRGLRRAFTILGFALAFGAMVLVAIVVRLVRSPAGGAMEDATGALTERSGSPPSRSNDRSSSSLTPSAASPPPSLSAVTPTAPDPEGQHAVAPEAPLEHPPEVAGVVAVLDAMPSAPTSSPPAREPPTIATTSAPPRPPAGAPRSSVARARPSESRAGEGEPSDRRGTLHVTVFPWGDVSIDGAPQGRSPVSVPISVGRHRVTARLGEASSTRSVTVTPDARTDVEFDLSNP